MHNTTQHKIQLVSAEIIMEPMLEIPELLDEDWPEPQPEPMRERPTLPELDIEPFLAESRRLAEERERVESDLIAQRTRLAEERVQQHTQLMELLKEQSRQYREQHGIK